MAGSAGATIVCSNAYESADTARTASVTLWCWRGALMRRRGRLGLAHGPPERRLRDEQHDGQGDRHDREAEHEHGVDGVGELRWGDPLAAARGAPGAGERHAGGQAGGHHRAHDGHPDGAAGGAEELAGTRGRAQLSARDGVLDHEHEVLEEQPEPQPEDDHRHRGVALWRSRCRACRAGRSRTP